MRPTTTASVTTVASSDPVRLDPSKEIFNVGLAVVLASTVNAKVQYSLDPWGSLTTWFDHATLANLTASAASVLTTPATAVRVTVNSVTGGSATLTVLQAG